MRGNFELDADGRGPLQRTANAIVYELLWSWRAKSLPDLFEGLARLHGTVTADKRLRVPLVETGT